VIVTTFRKAGVTDAKVGTRFLRRNAASRMLAAAVPTDDLGRPRPRPAGIDQPVREH
jgi:hypothetical protein